MAYANVEDVKNILPPDEDEIPGTGPVLIRLKTNLEEATDLIIAYLGREYDEADDDEDDVPDDVPPAVRRVVARVALRGFMDSPDNPGAQGETNAMGPFSYHINWSKEATSRDFYLTDSDKARLKRYRLVSTNTVGHAPMAGAGAAWWE